VLATHVICKVIFTAEASIRATTWSAWAIWFTAEKQSTLSALQFVYDAHVSRKVAFGSETLLMVTAIDCTHIRSLVLVHMLAGCATD